MNISGLAVGLACSIILFLYIHQELYYDSFHKTSKDTYRLNVQWNLENHSMWVATSAGKYGKTLVNEIPALSASSRVLYMGNETKSFISYQDKKLYETGLKIADANIFDFFSYQFVQGNPKKALQKPNSIVLSRSLAKKIFSSEHIALNKTIEIDSENFIVTAIIEDCPANSHLQFKGLISMSSIPKKYTDTWDGMVFWTYVKKNTNINLDELEQKATETILKGVYGDKKEQNKSRIQLAFQPLEDIHLYSTHLANDSDNNSSINYVYAFLGIAIFLVFIASINYMNLTTARSVDRAKEIGIRKVMGSYKSQLMTLFLIESVVITLIAFLGSLFLVELGLPFFNKITGQSLNFNYVQQPQLILWFFLLAVGIGLLSGFYPAFVLSAYNPVLVLKGKIGQQKKGINLRKTLVVFQFSISITLIISTWLIYRQVNFMMTRDLGFKKDQILVMETTYDLRKKVPSFTNRLEKIPGITQTAYASATQGQFGINYGSMLFEPENGGEMFRLTDITHYETDYDYPDLMGIELKKGRFFSKDMKTDPEKAIIINETLAQQAGWTNPVNKKIKYGKKEYYVIGLIKDFHFKSLHQKIEPMALFLNIEGSYNIFLKINSQDLKTTLKKVEKAWVDFDPKHPYNAYFLDQSFARQYDSDLRKGQIFLTFAALAIFIACLGLFGLASFTVRQRTKEIGIRKVLGANLKDIISLISREFVVLVLISSVIAIPVATYFVQQWLQEFAYRVNLAGQWSVFAFAILTSLLIALFTISFQAFKATRVNPVEVLKDE